jgi:diphthamide biosynthesis protein 3
MNGEEVARCPSCSLIIRVIYDPEDFQPPEEEAAEETEVSKPLEASNEITVA